MDNKVPEYAWDDQALQQDSSQSVDFREYLRILFKFKWGILSIAFLTGLLGLYTAYKAVPIYRSTVILQIEKQQNNMLNSGFYFDFQSKFYETQYELIRSWGVAEMAAERLGLLDADHLEGNVKEPKEPSFSWRSLIPDFLSYKPPEITPDVRRAGIISSIKNGARVDSVAESQLVTISFESSDSEMASRKANTVAESYIDFLRDKNLADITGDQSWFSSRLVKAREDLEEAQIALQDFLDRQGMVETSEGVDALQNQSYQAALTRREDARQQKLALQRLNNEIKQARTNGTSLDTITALTSRGIVTSLKSNLSKARQEVSKLSQRYGPRHPRMIEAQSALDSAANAYETELESAADGVLVDYQRAVTAEAEYTNFLDTAEADIQALNRSRAELTHLQDQVKTSRDLFEQLQAGEQRGELLQGGIQKINATIIEYARPGLYPVRPNKQRMTMTWVMGGLVLGVGLAFLLNLMDNTFKGSEDVERRLNLPVLGQLPQLKIDKGKKLEPMSFVLSQPRSAFSESIRTIRTGVILSMLDKPKSIITVTSSVPGEGKTTLAINLAHSIQQMKKTLLIDADMRRPMVHRAKKIEQPRPGLAALMTGEATFEEAHEETEDGLHVIPAGTVPANPLELLSSQKFKDMVAELQEIYDVIIIDSAPALAVSDALVVSQLADAQLYVIRADATPYQAAQQGIKRLRRVNAPLLGCILNQVVAGGGGYGYGKYGKYGRYYRYYRYGRYGYGRYGYYNADNYHDYYESSDDRKA